MEWFKKVLSDESDNPSTKRIVAMVGSAILFITLFVNSFSDTSKAPSPELISGCVMVISVALGATSIDKFSKKS